MAKTTRRRRQPNPWRGLVILGLIIAVLVLGYIAVDVAMTTSGRWS